MKKVVYRLTRKLQENYIAVVCALIFAGVAANVSAGVWGQTWLTVVSIVMTTLGALMMGVLLRELRGLLICAAGFFLAEWYTNSTWAAAGITALYLVTGGVLRYFHSRYLATRHF